MARRKNYIFTNKRHSDKAVMGMILGIISFSSMISVIALSYSKSGHVPVGYGFTGVLATLFSLVGLGLGVNVLRKKDSFLFFPWTGIILNVLTLGIIAMLLYVAA